jgi:hypothetical protein
VSDRVPSVLEQGLTAFFVRHEPLVRNYNSGLIQINGVQYLATRRFSRENWRCEIVINRLDEGAATPVRTLALPRMLGREWHEDARLFWYRGKVHCAYTEGQYWQRPWIAVQKLAILDSDWNVERVITIPFGENSVGQEKNWQFFELDDCLYFSYALAPQHVVVELRDYRPAATYRTDSGITQPLRGGTPPVRMGDVFITFPHFHGEHGGRARRYGFSALQFDAKAPFRILSATDTLILASEEDPTLPNLAYPHWHPIVAFPCGAQLNGDTWTVSAGINDSFDALFEIPHESLQFHPVSELRAGSPAAV